MTNATLMSEAGHSELGFWDNTGASSGEGGWGGVSGCCYTCQSFDSYQSISKSTTIL